jgi:hypothetical protein
VERTSARTQIPSRIFLKMYLAMCIQHMYLHYYARKFVESQKLRTILIHKPGLSFANDDLDEELDIPRRPDQNLEKVIIYAGASTSRND